MLYVFQDFESLARSVLVHLMRLLQGSVIIEEGLFEVLNRRDISALDERGSCKDRLEIVPLLDVMLDEAINYSLCLRKI